MMATAISMATWIKPLNKLCSNGTFQIVSDIKFVVLIPKVRL